MELAQGRRRMVYCGTESASVVVLELLPDGAAVVRQELANTSNPHGQKNGSPGGVAVEWVTLHPAGQFLYALTCFWTKQQGEAISYSVNPETGLLDAIGAPLSTGGFQPCHAEVSPSSSWLAIAHYLDGVVSVLACSQGRLLGEAHTIVLPGERFPMGKHKGPLAHGLSFTRTGAFLGVCDAGQGNVVVFPFNDSTGEVGPEPVAVVSSSPSVSMHGFVQGRLRRKMGARPRHLAFHPSLPVAYVLTECGNAVGWYGFDPERGSLGTLLGEVTCARFLRGTVECCAKSCFLPSLNFAAEIAASADGRFLYVSNRGIGPAADNSIVVFQIDQATGALSKARGFSTEKGPRHFCLFTAGGAVGSDVHLALVGNQASKSVGLYAVSDADGALRHVRTSEVGHAVDCVQVLELPEGAGSKL